MRGFDYIVDGAGLARLCVLALLIICFQALYVGLAMLLSRFLDLITMAISTGNADEVLGFPLRHRLFRRSGRPCGRRRVVSGERCPAGHGGNSREGCRRSCATGLFTLSGLVSVGSVIAVTQLSGDVISPAPEISSKLAKVKAGQEILALFRSIEDQSEKDGAHVTCTRRAVPASAFGLEGMSFAYDGEERQVLCDCSVRFKAGRKYAITGASGGGKSTLLGILAGALAPQAGSVCVDAEAGALPESVSIHQSVFLFDGTLRENITLWGAFEQDDIARAIRLAGLGEVVAALPQGLDTAMGENGARLSGGERQRVAIARALLHGKTVLLVDEATSALDAEMAEQVEDALLSLDGVTVIAVTHRLDETRTARYDKVLEMSEGHLVGEGSAEGRLGPAATVAAT